MKIKKVSQSAGIIAEIEQNLNSNSEVNAPSVKAVKTALKQVYSTEEQVIGTWMGKPLYRKSMVITEGFNTEMLVAHGIDNFGELIDVTATIYNHSAWHKMPAIYAPDITTYVSSAYSVNVEDVYITMSGSVAYAASKINVTIEYTKTTD